MTRSRRWSFVLRLWEALLKTFVLGLGDPALTDDGVGIHIVREFATRSLPTFGEKRTPAVAAAMLRAMEAIWTEIKRCAAA